MKIAATLVINHAENGEPLPHLKLEIGGSTYHVFTGTAVRDWAPGCTTERKASVDVEDDRA